MDRELQTLITRVRSGDESAFADLAAQYKPLVYRMAKAYSDKLNNDSVGFDDFIQEATLALYSAVCTYKETDKVTFGLYAKVCIRNRLVSYLRSISKKQKKQTQKRSENEPARRLIEKVDAEELEGKIKSGLSKLEWEVFCLYIQKKSYVEIAEAIGKSTKSVDNAICRIKTKLKKII